MFIYWGRIYKTTEQANKTFTKDIFVFFLKLKTNIFNQ